MFSARTRMQGVMGVDGEGHVSAQPCRLRKLVVRSGSHADAAAVGLSIDGDGRRWAFFSRLQKRTAMRGSM